MRASFQPMAGPVGIPVPSPDEMTVAELAAFNLRLYHATLLAGRALAAFGPTLGDVAPRAILVRSVHSLISQSGLLHARLLQMRVHPERLGQPAPASAAVVCGLLGVNDPQRAVAFGRNLLERLADLLTAVRDGCRSEHTYHDRRLYDACLDEVRAGLAPYEPHPHDPEGPGELPTPETYRDLGTETLLRAPAILGPSRTPTGTTPLPVPPCPERAYPQWARFTGVKNPDFRDPTAGASAREIVLHALRKGIATEFISTDVPLRNLADFPDMPLQFYLDMSRHAHDELRHTHLLLDHLTALGEDYRQVTFRNPDTYRAMADQPLDYRLVVLSRTGEDAAIEVLSQAVPKLRASGYSEVATMFDHVLADELRHVAYANHWLRHLHGDDQAVEQATTRCLERLNARVDELELGEFMRRETDHAARRGRRNADLELRELAGFSDYDLARMQAAGDGGRA
ncbi:DUF455 family protein [Streptomyces sp. NPDC046915]|uniref:DUF455 family protein n=1 Tax=Streptomyces sp. NPDC046915 TaxID=3155257 RepID=UPI0033CC9217